MSGVAGLRTGFRIAGGDSSSGGRSGRDSGCLVAGIGTSPGVRHTPAHLALYLVGSDCGGSRSISPIAASGWASGIRDGQCRSVPARVAYRAECAPVGAARRGGGPPGRRPKSVPAFPSRDHRERSLVVAHVALGVSMALVVFVPRGDSSGDRLHCRPDAFRCRRYRGFCGPARHPMASVAARIAARLACPDSSGDRRPVHGGSGSRNGHTSVAALAFFRRDGGVRTTPEGKPFRTSQHQCAAGALAARSWREGSGDSSSVGRNCAAAYDFHSGADVL